MGAWLEALDICAAMSKDRVVAFARNDYDGQGLISMHIWRNNSTGNSTTRNKKIFKKYEHYIKSKELHEINYREGTWRIIYAVKEKYWDSGICDIEVYRDLEIVPDGIGMKDVMDYIKKRHPFYVPGPSPEEAEEAEEAAFRARIQKMRLEVQETIVKLNTPKKARKTEG